MDEREVRHAWERFVERGAAPIGMRAAVVASWQRSRAHHVLVDATMAPLLAEAELFRHRSKHTQLMHAARPALASSSAFLSDANSMMILTDPSGVIIDTQGDARAIEAGRTIHLEHGGRWSEADIGTNAIGAAVAEARPVQIHGAEHFCADIQRWTCAAAPVRHPTDGEILGVVDISGPASTFSSQSLAFAVSVSQHVEGMLAQATKCDHERLLRRFLSKRSLWLSEEVIVLDRRGAIVHATERALAAVRRCQPDMVDGGAMRILKTVTFERWADKIGELLANVSTELVTDEAADVGAIIVLHPRRRSANTDKAVQKGGAPLNPRDRSYRPAPYREQAAPSPHLADAAGSAFVAVDPAVKGMVRQVETAAARKMPILIRGETGTGKEQLARHAHAASGRGGAFVPVNCAALPESLVEAELFGYADGAFTGARRGGAIGLVKEADGGTLFLDEIGDMPVTLQAVLLRLLDDWTVRPIGGSRAKVDVFLVSATNATLGKAIAEGRFRADLLYRLNTLEVTLPRLAERSDFPAIVRHLLAAIDPSCDITPATIARLAERPWAGNIRELRNVLTRYTLAASDGVIDEAAVQAMIGLGPPKVSGSLQDIQRARVLAVHADTVGNISETARRLGISRNTVYRALTQPETAGVSSGRPCDVAKLHVTSQR
ncbi:MAG: sigma-54-dependent Fis family transcriptional regulator [Roseiarcus sp.]|jgi:transcriptional regulator of acetoin/glycerol metabolism